MTLREQSVRPTDSEEPGSFPWWDAYARQDTNPVSDYLFERGEVSSENHTVPAAHYTSREFFDLEAERLWPRVWQSTCRVNEIPDVGDYFVYEIVGQSILVVRDGPESIKAFRNACRHRGATLVSEPGNVNCFVCPFHGWSYELDGALRQIPAAWDWAYLDPAEVGLVPCQAETFDGWVYINMDLAAPPLADHLGDVIPRHFAVHPDERMWKVWHYGVVVGSNWKVMTEAFFETYHVPRTHPSLVPYAGDIQTQYDAFGLHNRLCSLAAVPSVVGGARYSEREILQAAVGDSILASTLGAEAKAEEVAAVDVPEGMTARQLMAAAVRAQWAPQGVDLAGVSDAELIDAVLYFVFPNLMPFRSPAGHLVYRFRPHGRDPEQLLYEVMLLAPVADGADLPRDTPMQLLDPGQPLMEQAASMGLLAFLIDQDIANSPKVQAGLRGLDTILLGRRQEQNIVAFHRNLETWLSAGA